MKNSWRVSLTGLFSRKRKISLPPFWRVSLFILRIRYRVFLNVSSDIYRPFSASTSIMADRMYWLRIFLYCPCSDFVNGCLYLVNNLLCSCYLLFCQCYAHVMFVYCKSKTRGDVDNLGQDRLLSRYLDHPYHVRGFISPWWHYFWFSRPCQILIIWISSLVTR